MRTTLIISCLNQFELLNENLKVLTKDNDSDDFEILIIDNGSDTPFETDLPNVRVIRFEEPFGSYPVFKIALENTSSDILAFIHSDFIIWNPRWFAQVGNAFRGDSKLGLIGMIGSNSWGVNGGRGGGTMGSFQGRTLAEKWSGSSISGHGQDVTGQLRNACQLDGCSMIFRRECLESLPLDNWKLPHHFYDRVLSAWTLQHDWKIAVLGVECDHISGRTMGESRYNQMCKKWAKENLGIEKISQWIDNNKAWHYNITNPSHGEKPGDAWDWVIYQEAQKRFLQDFRDKQKFIPMQV